MHMSSFQGEESEIVIISLVRSNNVPADRNPIGFLRMANRVNVLLSRAKRAMYIIGNAATLVRDERDNIWPTIIKHLRDEQQV